MKFKGIELCCPHCRADLRQPASDLLACTACERRYPIILSIPDLRIFPDPYIDIEADRAKGRRVAGQFEAFDFAGLVNFYYSITGVVPPHHARQYTRGLLAGVGRAQAALAAWQPPGGALLDIGCGTAPMLVAAAPHFDTLVGVDIAFRWLVVAQKRLAEAGLDIPLICACAEALPFPDSTFSAVAAESVVEHVQDQQQMLAQALRVMQPGASLLLTTPNKYSLGPDPQAGLWAGGWLPEQWVAAYVRRQGGIPPKRRLLSAGELTQLVAQAGFARPYIFPPDVPVAVRDRFGTGMRLVIDGYRLARRLPFSRALLQRVGPLLVAISTKPAAAPERTRVV